MSGEHHATAPQDKVPFFGKIGYGTGMLGYALMIQIYMQFYNPIFNDCLGVDPVWIGWIILASRFWDAFTDPLMGSITDNTRSRWGRRRPWLALGAVLCAVTFVAIWWFPRGGSDLFYFGWFLVTSLLFYIAFTIFSVPYIALGMELTPDYHERTSVMAFRSILQQGGFFVVASLYWLTSLDRFADRAEAMRWNSLWIGALIFIVIIIPAFFAREHPSALAEAKKPRKKVPLWKSARETLSNWPFLNLALVTIVSLLGLMMVGSLGYYVTVYHMFAGDKGIASGAVLTAVGYAIPIATIVSIPLLNRLSRKIGKRSTMLFAFSIAVVGTLLKWPCYSVAHPYLSILPAVLLGMGSAAAYVFVNAMLPDAVDVDELKTGERREGMFSAVYSWMFKIGAAIAPMVGGYVLRWTGFDADLGAQSPETIFWMRVCFTVIPALSLLAAIALVLTYPISEKRSYEIRRQLEAMRREKNETVA
jgi:GPH family glycoside/pentoside/hexuronide:cation symporter